MFGWVDVVLDEALRLSFDAHLEGPGEVEYLVEGALNGGLGNKRIYVTESKLKFEHVSCDRSE